MDKIEEIKKEDVVVNKNIIWIRAILYLLAIVVIFMCFNGANGVLEASLNMSVLKSKSGNTVDEAFYQYCGTFLSGLKTVVQALGMTCGSIIIYIARKIK